MVEKSGRGKGSREVRIQENKEQEVEAHAERGERKTMEIDIIGVMGVVF
jgi:hypothetical protein